MPTLLFKITENNWPIQFEYAEWPLYLTILLAMSSAYLVIKEYKKSNSWATLLNGNQSINYILLLFSCIAVLGLLPYYTLTGLTKLFALTNLMLLTVFGYKLYKGVTKEGDINLKNLGLVERKYLAILIYSALVLLLYSKLTQKGGGLNVHAFAIFLSILTATLVFYIKSESLSTIGVSLKKQPYKTALILIVSAILIRILNLKGLLESLLSKFYPGQHLTAVTNIISILLVLIGVVTFTYFILWMLGSIVKPAEGAKAKIFFRNTTYSYSILMLILFYFGDNTFSYRLESSSTSSTSSTSSKVTLSQAQAFMQRRCNSLGHTLMKTKTVLSNNIKVYMFMSVTESGSVCISGISENALEVIGADCGSAEIKIEEWNAL